MDDLVDAFHEYAYKQDTELDENRKIAERVFSNTSHYNESDVDASLDPNAMDNFLSIYEDYMQEQGNYI